MKWLGFLTRAFRSPEPVPPAPPAVRPPAGMDHLLSTARMAEPAPPPQDPPVPDVAPVPAAQPEATAWAEEASWEALKDAAEERQNHEDWPAAERLWRTLRQRYAHIWQGYAGGAVALAGLGRFDDALPLLFAAAHRFPWEPAIHHELARLAARQGNWAAAAIHWRNALGFDVRPDFAYVGLAEALNHLGRVAEAEETMQEATQPKEITRFAYPAALPWAQQDWPAATASFARAHRRFPASAELANGLSQALDRLAAHEPKSSEALHRELGVASAMAATDDDRRALVPRFESLGGLGPGGGCEFGTFQRKYGFESLSLFRWASVSPESLLAALTARFAGLGDEDSTMVYIEDDDRDLLWQIGDKTYSTAMHSFIRSMDVSRIEMTALAQKRTLYLKDKLIADLEIPEKVFVLKVGYRHLTVAETTSLSRAIRSYGMGQLLCVCPADSAHPEGHIVPAAPGVFVGYIDFSGQLTELQRHAVWEVLCWSMLGLSDFPPA
jgi:tetratricopeptide (TPR) repeat protein